MVDAVSVQPYLAYGSPPMKGSAGRNLRLPDISARNWGRRGAGVGGQLLPLAQE